MVEAYDRRLTSPDERVRLPAARAWSTWEPRTS
jgi:proline iminopeptidase